MCNSSLWVGYLSEKEHRLLRFAETNPEIKSDLQNADEGAPEADPAAQAQGRINNLEEKMNGIGARIPADEMGKAKEKALKESSQRTDTGIQTIPKPLRDLSNSKEPENIEAKTRELNQKLQALRQSIDSDLLRENLALRCILAIEFIAKDQKIIARFPANEDVKLLVERFREDGGNIAKTGDYYEQSIEVKNATMLVEAFDLLKSAYGKSLPVDTPTEKEYEKGLLFVAKTTLKTGDHPTLTPKLRQLQKTMPLNEQKTAFGRYMQSLTISESATGDILLESSDREAFRAFQRIDAKNKNLSVRLRFTRPDITPEITQNGYRITIPRAQTHLLEEEVHAFEKRKNTDLREKKKTE